MRRKNASLIPEKAQVPVMVGGAIVLVLVVAWQFLPLGAPKETAVTTAQTAVVVPPAAPVAPIAAAAPGLPAADGSIAALEALVAEAQKEMTVLPAGAGIPPLASNPFSPLVQVSDDPDGPPPGMTAQEWAAQEEETGDPSGTGMEVAGDPDAPTAEEIDRQYRLASLNLTGTIKTGAWAMAVINDGYYRTGQKVEGFTVAAINEKEVLLRDAQGETKLYLEYNDGVSLPAAGPSGRVREDSAPIPAEPETLEPVETSISIGDSGF